MAWCASRDTASDRTRMGAVRSCYFEATHFSTARPLLDLDRALERGRGGVPLPLIRPGLGSVTRMGAVRSCYFEATHFSTARPLLDLDRALERGRGGVPLPLIRPGLGSVS